MGCRNGAEGTAVTKERIWSRITLCMFLKTQEITAFSLLVLTKREWGMCILISYPKEYTSGTISVAGWLLAMGNKPIGRG